MKVIFESENKWVSSIAILKKIRHIYKYSINNNHKFISFLYLLQEVNNHEFMSKICQYIQKLIIHQQNLPFSGVVLKLQKIMRYQISNLTTVKIPGKWKDNQIKQVVSRAPSIEQGLYKETFILEKEAVIHWQSLTLWRMDGSTYRANSLAPEVKLNLSWK